MAVRTRSAPRPSAPPSTVPPGTALGRAVVRQERALLASLAVWSLVSGIVGALTWRQGRTRSRAGEATAGSVLVGVGRQGVAWALVDAAVAGWGASRSRPVPVDDRRARRRAWRMAALTSGNAVLEVGYVASGVRLMREPARRGDGLGIVVQSAFLLWLDARHAVRFAALARTDRSADAPDRP